MTKRQTKGRRRSAIKRAHSVYLAIAANPGKGPGFLQEATGITSGQWQTAIKYLIQDGLVEQRGLRRGSTFYPSNDLNGKEVLEVLGDSSKNNSVYVDSVNDELCTFCNVAPVDSFKFYTNDNGTLSEKETNENIVAAMRQAFHLCKRCANFRMPSPAMSELRNNVYWQHEYNSWQNPDIGVELTVKFKEWVYGIAEDDTYHLYGIVSLPDINDQEYCLPFTFNDRETGLTKYARGYRYLYRLMSHPDNLVGNKVVVSREKHKTSRPTGASWFWSWTPWPRIPAHLRREANAEDEMVATEQLDGPVADVSSPQHHIHSIEDHGAYTIIRVNKNVSSDDSIRVKALEDIIQAFLFGNATVIDLEKTLQGDE